MVLVGAGHAHLWVTAKAAALRRRGASVTLVAPGPTWYSGMATGMLGGRYEAADDQIEPAHVAAGAGADFVREEAIGLDREARAVRLASGSTLPYDLVSFAVGSRVQPLPREDDAAPALWPVKPIEGLARLRATLEQRFRQPEPTRIVVLGAGATGCELAANLLALARRCRHRAAITLAGRDERILPEAAPGAAEALASHLQRRGATIETGVEIDRIGDGAARAGERAFPAEHVVLATGLRAHPLMEQLGLPADPEDGLRVDATLRSIADERVHAVGDCAAFEPRRLPRVGVFGVRQAPVLLGNLAAALDGRGVKAFRPQRRWLAILNLGDGRALALYGRHWALGRWPMRLKERLDRGFVQAFR